MNLPRRIFDKRTANRCGLTMIELVLTLALMGIVLAAGFTFFFFGTKAYKNADVKADNQFDVRMPAEFISKEVAYASSVQLLSSAPSPTANYYDIFLDAGQIKYHENGVLKVIPGTAGVTNFAMTFNTNGSRKILLFTVGKSGTALYNTTTEVTPLNLSAADTISGTAPAIGVRFKKERVIP